MPKHGLWTRRAVTMALGLGLSAWGQAQTKTTTLLVPYPAGGLSDAIARIVSPALQKQLGQQVVVDNLGGVSGTLAAAKVAAAPADGALVFQGSPNELILAPLALKSVRIKPEDFKPVQIIGVGPIAILARPGLAANNVDELVDLARKASAAGKPLTYGSVGVGSFYHVLGEHFAQTIGAKMQHVPYKGFAPMIQDFGGDLIDIAIIVTGTSAIGLQDNKKLKILGTLAPAGQTEVAFLSKVPSINDSKSIKNFAFNIWTSYFVRKDTPDAVVDQLNKAFTAVLGDPEVRGKLESLGMMTAKPVSVPENARQYAFEVKRFGDIARSIKLEAQ